MMVRIISEALSAEGNHATPRCHPTFKVRTSNDRFMGVNSLVVAEASIHVTLKFASVDLLVNIATGRATPDVIVSREHAEAPEH